MDRCITMSAPEHPLNFLFATWEGGGSVTPALTVVRKLVRHGHRVRVISDRCNRPESEAAGASFVPWTRAPSRPDRSRDTDFLRDWDVAAPHEGLQRLVEKIMAGPALAYAEDVIEELRREPADLVVSSEILPGVAVGCEHLGQRMALLAVNLSLFPVPGIPPLGPGLAPARTEADRVLHEEVARANVALWDTGLPALNVARAALGLEPLASLVDYPLRAGPMLLATSRAFDFAPASLPPNVRYVGPQVGEPAWAEPWRSPGEKHDPRPIVAVCFSTSFQNHIGTLQRLIDAMAELPVRGVVTLGDSVLPHELAPSANVELVHSAPHDALMRAAAVVVTHGGHGTVIRALAHRRPMLVIPHGRDQNDNAVRVTERRAGLSLPADASVGMMTSALAALLADRSFASAADALGAEVAREIEQSPVVDELEHLARGTAGAEIRAA